VAQVASPAVVAAQGCARPGLLLCDDFESGALDAHRWTVKRSHARLEVDTTRAAHGGHALHARVDDVAAPYGSRATVTSREAIAIAGSRVFVRIWVYVTEPRAMPERHYTVMSASGTDKLPDGGALGYTVNVVPDRFTDARPQMFRFLWSRGPGEPGGEKYAAKTELAPAGRWACWEWEMRGASNEQAFSVDGARLASFAVTPEMGWTAPGRAQLVFGFQTFHPEPAHPAGFDFWIDDIAVANQPIGCAP
jgi:hypothetical protein